MPAWLRRLLARLFPPPKVPVGPVGNVAETLLKLHNAERAAARLPLLTLDPRLTVAAQGHVVHMALKGRLAHSGIGDGDPWTRIAAAGYVYSAASENIAWNERDAAEALKAWMDDPPHRANVLGDWTHMGGAMARGSDGSPYWVCDFARP